MALLVDEAVPQHLEWALGALTDVPAAPAPPTGEVFRLLPAGQRHGETRPAWGWRHWYRVATAGGDVIAFAVASVLAALLGHTGLRTLARAVSGELALGLLAVVVAGAWIGALASSRVWDRRVIGLGNDEYRRLLSGALRFAGGASLVGFLVDADFLRRLLFVGLPVLTVMVVGVHNLARTALGRMRRHGRAEDKVVVVGSPAAVGEVVDHLQRTGTSGLRVVGSFTGSPAAVDGDGLVALGGDRQALLSLLRGGAANTVAVIDPELLGPGGLRRLGWEIEGLGIDILVAPPITEVAGPRLSVHPVAGLPLVHVEEARLSGVGRAIKESVERALAVALLVVLAPLLAITAAVIKATSPGPAIFRQVRVGRHGEPFVIFKFRTMCADAEARLEDLIDLSDTDGLMFKMQADPRVTPVGRVLRRLSIDELPQLWNVVLGHMSIVGPRPPLPSEVERYPAPVGRRLLVKPGLTGLWQVSGRSNLPWAEGVLLDLHYVDNWSPTMDLVIMARTLKAILMRRGAY